MGLDLWHQAEADLQALQLLLPNTTFFWSDWLEWHSWQGALHSEQMDVSRLKGTNRLGRCMESMGSFRIQNPDITL